ncbi:hypothetical protein VFPPC_16803 [Pochonia chlamydosporia 170]|uniref:Uncharacterized protein n=1 Tax=Pochonia chlamydosporia 170 TaxID=1380566 RepID=A0A179F327_METCM|nr:hypothetical protein VFPPC_16803 [Pochonia chlamydosporia 170]OAQ59826.1 hypothetical protein VFPPC_16803 [Pochonia chlamydosporia 170]
MAAPGKTCVGCWTERLCTGVLGFLVDPRKLVTSAALVDIRVSTNSIKISQRENCFLNTVGNY